MGEELNHSKITKFLYRMKWYFSSVFIPFIQLNPKNSYYSRTETIYSKMHMPFNADDSTFLIPQKLFIHFQVGNTWANRDGYFDHWRKRWNRSLKHTFKLKIFSKQILLIIGGELDDFVNEVCGAILNVRARCDKIAVWTPNVNKASEVLGIG